MDPLGNIERVTVAGRRAFPLRHGVLMPEWSFVTDPAAREALGASMAAAGRAEKWSGLSAAEDRVWRAVLRGFGPSGRAPDAAWLAAAARLDEAAVVPVLRALHQRDLVVLDAAGASVAAAYPFCAWETGHVVRLASGVVVNALCAIDALGTGAMLGCDTVIESPCRGCGEPVRLATCNKGHALRSKPCPRASPSSGGGYIAAAFSHLAARAGAKATVFQRGSRMLPQFGPDLGGWLMESFAALDIDVRTGTVVRRIERTADGFLVHSRRGRPGAGRGGRPGGARGRPNPGPRRTRPRRGRGGAGRRAPGAQRVPPERVQPARLRGG